MGPRLRWVMGSYMDPSGTLFTLFPPIPLYNTEYTYSKIDQTKKEEADSIGSGMYPLGLSAGSSGIEWVHASDQST